MGNNTKTKTKILSTATFIVSALFNVACNNLLSLTEAGQHKTRTNDNLALRIHMKNVKVACPQLRPANALIKKHRVHDYLSIQDV
jgi:hypothetical protein